MSKWRIEKFRSRATVNTDYDRARVYIELPLIEALKLIKKLNEERGES